MYAKKEKIYPAYALKHNSNCEKQVILLMIANGAGLALSCSKKTISIIKRNNVLKSLYFSCLNCLHYFAKENKNEPYKKST